MDSISIVHVDKPQTSQNNTIPTQQHHEQQLAVHTNTSWAQLAGDDVWIHHVGPQLTTRDIVALSMTCHWGHKIAHNIGRAKDVCMLSDKSPQLSTLRHVLRLWPNFVLEFFFQDNRRLITDAQLLNNLEVLGKTYSLMVCGCRRLTSFSFISPQLRKLHLPGTKLEFADCQKLRDSLTTNTTLTTLDLADNNLGDGTAQIVASALLTNKSITSLNLGGNHVGQRTSETLCEVMQKNSHLTALLLWGNDVGDDGAEFLARGMTVNTTLTALNLWSNKIGEEGGQAILSSLMSNNTLTSLNIANNPIPLEIHQHIHARVCNNRLLSPLPNQSSSSASTTPQPASSARTTPTRSSNMTTATPTTPTTSNPFTFLVTLPRTNTTQSAIDSEQIL